VTSVARFDGKVVLITGGARGQGRSHALAFAERGADVVIIDACTDVPTVSYSLAGAEDLEQTRKDVEALDRRCLAIQADVRDAQAMQDAVAQTVAELGRLDIVIANAGVASYHRVSVMPPEAWRTVIDINLTGVFNIIHAAAPVLAEQGSGRIIATSSTMGRMGSRNASHYSASKWGVIGLVKSAALELAPNGVTVNAVAPVAVNTPLIQNDEVYRLFCPDVENPTWEDAAPRFAALTPIGVPHIECADVTHAMLFLASDEARYITGAVLDVTAGKSGAWTG
jgi:SDR family mycofactocin-dependent oxidoreductase